MKSSEKMRAIRALFPDKRAWLTGQFHDDGCGHCLMGAVNEVCYGSPVKWSNTYNEDRAEKYLHDALPKSWKPLPGFSHDDFYRYNDEHTFPTIMRLIDRAILAAEDDGD